MSLLSPAAPKLAPWKVLLVDDESDIHDITKLTLSHFGLDGRALSFVHAYNVGRSRSTAAGQTDGAGEVAMNNTGRNLAAAMLAGVALSGIAFPVLGQTGTLPAPSRTMFKCIANKKVTYTDQPCLGAQRLDVVPSRGLNKLSGTERIGADVANERRREQFAESVKPLTGMEPPQFAVAVRRHSLGAAASRECQALDPAIAEAEAQERNADRPALPAVQRYLFSLRKRYKELHC